MTAALTHTQVIEAGKTMTTIRALTRRIAMRATYAMRAARVRTLGA